MEKAINKEVRCPTCGTLFRELGDLLQVHAVGLALMGTCPQVWRLCSLRGIMDR